MRGFRCIPVALKYSDVMDALSSFERDVVWSSLVAQDDYHALPYNAARLKSEIFPGRPFVGLREIANARDKLVALGVFIRKASAKKEWLEIAPDYRHQQGQNETSFGDEPPAPQQTHLSLGPIPMEHVASRPRAAKNPNPSRVEKEQKQNPNTESAMTKKNEPPEENAGEESENRAQSSGVDPRFARAVELVTSSKLGKRLAHFLGKAQMLKECEQSGAQWIRILNEKSAELEFILEQAERIAATELPTGQAKAKFITRRLALNAA